MRLGDNTVFVPDILIAERAAVLADRWGMIDAATVRFVAEIVSPGSPTTDRVTKPTLYANAGIPSYWRVEPEGGPIVIAHRLVGQQYVEGTSAGPGRVFEVDEPYPVSFDPEALKP